MPSHIQKYVAHSLLVDFQVSGVTINSGLAVSDFAIPTAITPVGGQQ
ncbi:MAG: hypothetical protein ACRD18_00175 [Terriglobia bacterium]